MDHHHVARRGADRPRRVVSGHLAHGRSGCRQAVRDQALGELGHDGGRGPVARPVPEHPGLAAGRHA